MGNVLQYLALSRATGRLTVTSRGALQGSVYLENGEVVFIEAKPFRDLGALASMLSWDSGTFVFKRDVPAPRRTLRQQVDLLLFQVSQRPALGNSEPPPSHIGRDAVLAAASGEGMYKLADDQFYADAEGEVLLSLGALHLWRKLDGASSLGQLAAAAGQKVDDLVAAALELMDHGLATFVSLRVADPRFVQELKREAIDLLGPVGEVVIEDALFELGLVSDSLPISSVEELFEELERSFPWRLRAEFMRRAAALRTMYALDSNVSVGRRGRVAT